MSTNGMFVIAVGNKEISVPTAAFRCLGTNNCIQCFSCQRVLSIEHYTKKYWIMKTPKFEGEECPEYIPDRSVLREDQNDRRP